MNNMNMITLFFMKIVRIFPFLRKLIRKTLYEQITYYYHHKSWIFMNYGYDLLNKNDRIMKLHTTDEPYRYFIQLYHHTIGGIDLHGMDVLEVGCGRGGGVYYMKRYLKPKTIIGLDYSIQGINFCKRNYSGNGLSFVYGDAEALPFKDKSFDVVVNVESSHSYISKSKFFKEVARVLKKNGYFCYTDLCDTDKYDNILKQVHNSGMYVIKEEDITAHVIRALETDGPRRLRFFKQTLPEKINIYHFREFAGVKGSAIYGKFKSGKVMYFCFLLCKRYEVLE